MRVMLSLLFALLPAAVLAQAKIERIRLEDNANRIEEVRVGGQTQSVTVQPKADLPSYELPPNDLARSRPADGRDGLAERKQRVWNVLSF